MAKLDKDWVDAYFDHGVDITNRRVFLDSEIEEQTISPVVKGLYLMETVNKDLPIEMFISSFGGSLYDAIGLYDIMNTIKCPIHTFGYGKIMSAAPMLLAAGEPGQRWVAPHASFMHHDMSTEETGTRQHHAAGVKHMEGLYEIWIGLLAAHSNKDKRWWNTKTKLPHDFYYSAEEALEWGLADSMWVEKG